MKIRCFLNGICIAFICFFSSNYAVSQQNNATVKISETGSLYELQAKYDQDKTPKIREYMSESLRETGFSFKNTQMDANLTLNGGINFYIKLYPGELVLKFDKRKNNTNDYTKFKKMCEGIKNIVQQN